MKIIRFIPYFSIINQQTPSSATMLNDLKWKHFWSNSQGNWGFLWDFEIDLAFSFSGKIAINLPLIWKYIQIYYPELLTNSILEALPCELPHSLQAFLQSYKEPQKKLKRLHQLIQIFFQYPKFGFQQLKSSADFDLKATHYPFFHLLDNVQLLCPIDIIPTYRDFYTFLGHVQRGHESRGLTVPQEWFEFPTFYKGSTQQFIGHQETIFWPSYSQIMDYECEVALIIASDGFQITEGQAHKYILGFSLLNDFSARDHQRKEMKIGLGPSKGKDFATAMGPYIYIPEFLSHLHETTEDSLCLDQLSFTVEVWINKTKVSQGSSSESHYTWSQMIEYASHSEWLRSGDVLGSGTFNMGCGLETQTFLKSGDLVELISPELGTLSHRIIK